MTDLPTYISQSNLAVLTMSASYPLGLLAVVLRVMTVLMLLEEMEPTLDGGDRQGKFPDATIHISILYTTYTATYMVHV